jgi:hypothetical protein
MLLDKPSRKMPKAGSEPGQGWAPGSTVSPPRCPGPRSASGTGHNGDVPSGPPHTGLANAICPSDKSAGLDGGPLAG